MRNLPHYSLHPFVFYKNIVGKRHNPARDSLLSMEAQMQAEFEVYIQHDLDGTLHQLPQMPMTEEQKTFHLGNYAYRKTKDLREAVMLRDKERLDTICPFCTINEYHTMDHFLPKELYPAHSVNSNNLIPCCQICQDYKLSMVQDGGNRLFLNLYSDILPEEQYLFVRFNFTGNVIPDVEFYMQNINGIDHSLYRIINSHYAKLHLFERFQDLAADEIISLQSTIIHMAPTQSDDDIKHIVYLLCAQEKDYHGANYWKSILKQACVEDDQMLSLIRQNRFV